jgi:ribose transport system substrate-binding protein
MAARDFMNGKVAATSTLLDRIPVLDLHREKAKMSRLYLVPILSKAMDILELIESERRALTLEDIFQQVPISKSSVYRILKTFVHRGYLTQSQDGRYRAAQRRKKIRFGFATPGGTVPFSEAVTASLRSAATNSGIELVVIESKCDPAAALRNAEEFVGRGVDLVIGFQMDEQVAPLIGHTLASAGIPVIAIDIPHPHATYFGVDNFRVGFEAGELLAQHAIDHWKGKPDWVIGLDVAEARSVVQGRITGAFQGVRSRLPQFSPDRFQRLEGGGLRHRSYQVTAGFLRDHQRQRILVAAATDNSVLGVLQAVRETSNEKNVAAVGQDCIPEVLQEMRSSAGCLIGSVSYEADTYGPRLVQLGLAILQGNAVPPYNFVHHKVVTPANQK